MCVFLFLSSNKRLPFQNWVSAIFDGRCLISDQFVDDAHQNHQNPHFPSYCLRLITSFALRAKYKKGDFCDFCERRLQIHHKLSSAPKKWLRARFEMGGAYLNLNYKHIVRFIFKIFKKYHENQRKKLILTKYVLNKFKFHAKSQRPYFALFPPFSCCLYPLFCP